MNQITSPRSSWRTPCAQHVVDVAVEILNAAHRGDPMDGWSYAWAKFIVAVNT